MKTWARRSAPMKQTQELQIEHVALLKRELAAFE
jgi:hypothetical protein